MSSERDWFHERSDPEGLGLSLLVSEKLHAEDSEFQTIEIYETAKFGRLMVIDGFVMLTQRDNFVYHEMMTHPVLYTHAAPRRVAVIGGGDCGTLREVLRHPEIERATQVEIDRRVTELSEIYFPELCEANDDARARLVFDDGIRWVTEAEPGSLDVIIVDSTDPIGPAEGLFNRPFYEKCRRALGEGGLLVQQSESPLLHKTLLRDMHGAMREAGFSDVRTMQFPQPTYPSGWWSATMARKEAGIDGFRRADAENRPFRTDYYSADVHAGALAMPPFFRRFLEGE